MVAFLLYRFPLFEWFYIFYLNILGIPLFMAFTVCEVVVSQGLFFLISFCPFPTYLPVKIFFLGSFECVWDQNQLIAPKGACVEMWQEALPVCVLQA